MAYKKCVICGEVISDGESVPYKGRSAHTNCFNIAMKALQKSKVEHLDDTNKTENKKSKTIRAELKLSLSEEEYQDKKEYYAYVKQLITDVQLSPKIYVLSDDYIKKYNFTFKGMYLTLVYLKEIMDKELVGDIVGIIPYYYEEAKQYYISVQKINNNNNEISLSGMYKEKTIKIAPKQKKIIQLDITSIVGK
jgi:hypothetical protein